MRHEHKYSSLKQAADQMMVKIKEAWKTPFDCPIVIFPDAKLEQWFRLYWIKKYGTLANLNSMRINGFIHSLIGQDSSSNYLSLEVLNNVLLAYLFSHLEILCAQFPELKDYFFTDGQRDDSHIYDFSCRLSSLYLDYEISRPSMNGKDGLIKTWKAGKDFFEGAPKEDWERKIYCDLFFECDGKGPFFGIYDGGIKSLASIYEEKRGKGFDYSKFLDSRGNVLPVFLFGFTKLGMTYQAVLEEFAEINELYFYGQDEELVIPESLEIKVTAAPSVIREVEHLHTNIAQLLQKGVKADEIAVVSPDLDNYRNAIYQIFSHWEDEKSLNIPFSILDSSSNSSVAGEALSIIFDILNEGTITRPAFFSLIRNPLVQRVRGIASEDVGNWCSWVEAMNVYRDRETRPEEWANSVKRVLISRLYDGIYSMPDGSELSPFANLETQSDEVLCGFVEAIKDLEELLEFRRNHVQLTEEALEKFKVLLDKWLFLESMGEGFDGDAIIYSSVVNAVGEMKVLFKSGVGGISWLLLSLILLDSAQACSYSSGKLFVNGISFYKFAPNRVIPVKYLFFIGANSKVFPGRDASNTMDLRLLCPWEGEETNTQRNKHAFFRQIGSTTEKFEISFRNVDLTKAETLYITTLMNDIEKQRKVEYEVMSLDENRSEDKLFTAREFRNKDLFINLLKEEKSGKKGKNSASAVAKGKSGSEGKTDSLKDLPERVGIFQFKAFIDDPIQFHVNKVSFYDEDGLQEVETYEPLALSSLQVSSIVRQLVSIELLERRNLKMEGKSILEDLIVKGGIPDGVFGQVQLEDIESMKENFLSQMQENSPNDLTQEWEYKKVIDNLVFEQKLSDEEIKWCLFGEVEWYNETADENGLVTEMQLAFFCSTAEYVNAWISPFIQALALISLQNHESIVNVRMIAYQSKSDACEEHRVSLTPQQARERLMQIYDLAYVQKYRKAIPASLFDKNFTCLDDLVDALLNDYNHPAWIYFEKKYLVNTETDLGFSNEDNVFQQEWEAALKQQKGLFEGSDILAEM